MLPTGRVRGESHGEEVWRADATSGRGDTSRGAAGSMSWLFAAGVVVCCTFPAVCCRCSKPTEPAQGPDLLSRRYSPHSDRVCCNCQEHEREGERRRHDRPVALRSPDLQQTTIYPLVRRMILHLFRKQRPDSCFRSLLQMQQTCCKRAANAANHLHQNRGSE